MSSSSDKRIRSGILAIEMLVEMQCQECVDLIVGKLLPEMGFSREGTFLGFKHHRFYMNVKESSDLRILQVSLEQQRLVLGIGPGARLSPSTIYTSLRSKLGNRRIVVRGMSFINPDYELNEGTQGLNQASPESLMDGRGISNAAVCILDVKTKNYNECPKKINIGKEGHDVKGIQAGDDIDVEDDSINNDDGKPAGLVRLVSMNNSSQDLPETSSEGCWVDVSLQVPVLSSIPVLDMNGQTTLVENFITRYTVAVHEYGDLSRGSVGCGKITKIIGSIDVASQAINKSSLAETVESPKAEHAVGDFIQIGKLFVDVDLKLHQVIGHGICIHRSVIKVSEFSSNHDELPSFDPNPLNSDTVCCGLIARSAGVMENEKRVCTCSGRTVWEEASLYHGVL